MQTKLYQVLFDLQQQVGALSKDKENPFYHSQYYDINQLLAHLMPLFKKHGILCLQPIKEGKVYTILVDKDGNTAESYLELPQLDDPQKIGSCITYYRRYTLSSLLAMQSEDDDGNKAIPKKDEDDKPWLNEGSEEFEKAKEFIKNGGTLEQIRKKYKVSKKTAELL